MKTKYAALLPLSTIGAALLLEAPTRAVAQTPGNFEPKQLKEDFQIARHALEEAHPGIYRYTPKFELDRIFDEAEKSLNHPMDFYGFYRVMTLPIAAIKCGHTAIGIAPDVEKETESQLWLPFDVKVLNHRPYIFRDYARKGTLAEREIQAINGLPASRIISTMLAAEGQDGDIQTSRERVIAQHFALNLIALLELKAPYEVMLAGSGTNQSETVQVPGLKHEEMLKMSKALYPEDNRDKKFAELEFLDAGKIANLTYSAFGTDIDGARAFIKHAFEAIRVNGTKALILDMRGNLGGEGEIGGLLCSYLVDKPFKYYDDLLINKSSGMSYSFAKYTDKNRDLIVPPGIAELRSDGKVHQIEDSLLALQQPSKPAFLGSVYILINGRCFSSTAEFLTVVHYYHRAKFIGEESAGAYYGNNSGTIERITLPNTKLGVYIPFVSGYMAVGGTHDHEAARGILPDFPVQYSIKELVSGEDKDLKLALELARKNL